MSTQPEEPGTEAAPAPSPATARRPSPAVRGRRSSRVTDLLLSGLLAVLFLSYIDFKIRMPDVLVVQLPQTIPVPSGIDNVEMRVSAPVAANIRFGIDGPKEVLGRLKTMTLQYDFGITKADVERAVERGVIEHTPEIAHVVNLPANITQRDEPGYPQPNLIKISVTPFCKMEVTNFTLVGDLDCSEGLQATAEQPASTVLVKILGLAEPPDPKDVVLEVHLDEHAPFLVEMDRDVALREFRTVALVGRHEYRAEAIQPSAALRVRVGLERITVQQKVRLLIAPHETIGADDPPAEINLEFSVPARDAEDYKEKLRLAASRGQPFPLYAIVLFPFGDIPAGDSWLAKDPVGVPLELPVTVYALPDGVVFVGLAEKVPLTLQQKQ